MKFIYPEVCEKSLMVRVWGAFVNPAFWLNEDFGFWVYRRFLKAIDATLKKARRAAKDKTKKEGE